MTNEDSQKYYTRYTPVIGRLVSQHSQLSGGGPSIVPIRASRQYQHYTDSRHCSACRHYLLFPSVPSISTGTVPGSRHHGPGTVEGPHCTTKQAPTVFFTTPRYPSFLVSSDSDVVCFGGKMATRESNREKGVVEGGQEACYDCGSTYEEALVSD